MKSRTEREEGWRHEWQFSWVTSPAGGGWSSEQNTGSKFKPLIAPLQQHSLHVICSPLDPVSESSFGKNQVCSPWNERTNFNARSVTVIMFCYDIAISSPPVEPKGTASFPHSYSQLRISMGTYSFLDIRLTHVQLRCYVAAFTIDYVNYVRTEKDLCGYLGFLGDTVHLHRNLYLTSL